MVTNSTAYVAFKARLLAEQVLNLDEKYRILEALYKEARYLGSFGDRDRLLGLDDDVRLAKALNANVSEAPR